MCTLRTDEAHPRFFRNTVAGVRRSIIAKLMVKRWRGSGKHGYLRVDLAEKMENTTQKQLFRKIKFWEGNLETDSLAWPECEPRSRLLSRSVMSYSQCLLRGARHTTHSLTQPSFLHHPPRHPRRSFCFTLLLYKLHADVVHTTSSTNVCFKHTSKTKERYVCRIEGIGTLRF